MAGVPRELILVWTRKSSISTIGVLPAVRGTAHGSTALAYPNIHSTPQVAADYSIEQGHAATRALGAFQLNLKIRWCSM